MRCHFILRIHKPDKNIPDLSSLRNIVVCDVTILSKPNKFGGICFHKSNSKKHGYTVELSKSFNSVSGSHSYPTLSFPGTYIDIIIRNFPRYPAFYQCKYAARNCLNGWGYTNYMNKGFPKQLLYRKIEFLTLENDRQTKNNN